MGYSASVKNKGVQMGPRIHGETHKAERQTKPGYGNQKVASVQLPPRQKLLRDVKKPTATAPKPIIAIS